MKRFLENNKIYFEIFSMSFLGLMAVIVSFTQWRTSNQEFQLHKNENMPLFKISYELVKTDTSNTYDTEILKVTNEGKTFKKFKKEFFSFYLINIKSLDYPTKETEFFVPVADFFGISYNSGNLSGELFQSFSYGNNTNIANTDDFCRNLFRSKRLLATASRHVYFKFNFTDISDEKHTVFMDTYGNEIDEEDYIKTERKMSNSELRLMVMREMTPDFINSIVDKVK